MRPAQDPVEALLAALTANSCATHGPLAPADVAACLARRAAHHAASAAPGAPVALAASDPVLAGLDLLPALEATGLPLLLPDDPAWRDTLPLACVGITGAALAVAEQGVLAVPCGPGQPRGTSLLPPVHLCALRAADVVAGFAEAVERAAAAPLPSALTWVGGPSRTGDLEMETTLGVHGPRVVEVVVIDTLP